MALTAGAGTRVAAMLDTRALLDHAGVGAPLHDCMLVFRFGDGPGLIPPSGSSEARDINEFGQIAGWVMGPDHTARAVRWDSDESMLELGTLGGKHSCALGMNLSGDVVGWAQTRTGEAHAFLWRDGVMTDLGQDRDDLTVGFAVNDVGQSVGMAWPIVPVPVGSMGRALEWTEEGAVDLGTCLDVYCSAALDVNNDGAIVGWSIGDELNQRAFLWTGTSRTDLGALAPGRSQARAINDAGSIVGWYEVSDGVRHAGLWANGTLSDLSPPETTSLANDIAESGEIAGAVEREGGRLEPVLWIDDGIVSLGTLGGSHGEAYATNRFRETVGWSETDAGVPHAFLWKDGTMVDLTVRVVGS
jgi:probable HAF family extracellular repeat protein